MCGIDGVQFSHLRPQCTLQYFWQRMSCKFYWLYYHRFWSLGGPGRIFFMSLSTFKGHFMLVERFAYFGRSSNNGIFILSCIRILCMLFALWYYHLYIFSITRFLLVFKLTQFKPKFKVMISVSYATYSFYILIK